MPIYFKYDDDHQQHCTVPYRTVPCGGTLHPHSRSRGDDMGPGWPVRPFCDPARCFSPLGFLAVHNSAKNALELSKKCKRGKFLKKLKLKL